MPWSEVAAGAADAEAVGLMAVAWAANTPTAESVAEVETWVRWLEVGGLSYTKCKWKIHVSNYYLIARVKIVNIFRLLTDRNGVGRLN